MNPARTFGPDLVRTDFTAYWVYVAGPLTGAAIAVGFAGTAGAVVGPRRRRGSGYRGPAS